MSCALYLCSTNSTSTTEHGPPGSIACPLCRHGIVSFNKLPGTTALRENARTSLSLSLCACLSEDSETTMLTPFCRPDYCSSHISPPQSSSYLSISCQRFPSVKLNSTFCLGAPDCSPSLDDADRRLHNHLGRCSRSSLQPSASHIESVLSISI